MVWHNGPSVSNTSSKGVRRGRHNGRRGRLEWSEDDGQHGCLEETEEGPA